MTERREAISLLDWPHLRWKTEGRADAAPLISEQDRNNNGE